ncbi:MAG: DEAD/DEAH box helicase [Planctomycetota bacterium]
MKKFVPHAYQHRCLSWLIKRTIVDDHAGGALFLDPGLGKTATTLAWIKLLRQLGKAHRVLIVAPLRVVYSVWGQECSKWEQFAGLRCSILHGSKAAREKALAADADLFLINPEGMEWLKGTGRDFDALVVDESSKFKNWSAKRTKALRKMLDSFRYRVILTGTPSPNGIADLFSQVFIVDQGETLGRNVTQFRERYFYRGGYGGYQWLPNEGSATAIQKKIAPLAIRLSSEDNLDLPEMLINDVWVDLPKPVLKDYKRLEREMFIALESGEEIVAGNAGSKYNACRQFAGGAVYDEERNAQSIHDSKITALLDLIDELQGKPILIAYAYTHELHRIQKALPKCPAIYGETSGTEADRLIEKWNSGGLRVLAVQPKSLSHGINMQAGPGRDIAWFSLTDNLEDYQQLNKRIHRQGVTGNVRIHRLLSRRTVDEAISARLESKDNSQAALLNAIREYGDRDDPQT